MGAAEPTPEREGRSVFRPGFEDDIDLHLYPSPLRHESRMLKETWALREAGFFRRIHLVGILDEGLDERQQLDSVRSMWRVRTLVSPTNGARIIRLALISEWMLRVLAAYRSVGIRAVSCHNLASLPLGVALKLKTGGKLVYDTHELETERQGWSVPMRLLTKLVERALMPFVDYTVVVSESIGAWYQQRYPSKTIRVVRNVPMVETSVPLSGEETDLRRVCEVPEDSICYLMQGVLGSGRGIEALVEAFEAISCDAMLVLLGFAESEKYERALERLLEGSTRVVRHPSVPPQRILEYTKTADVGLYVVEPTCLSYQLTVGNKIYEYLLAGLPVIGSNFPEIRQLLEDRGCGWNLEIRPDSLRALIDSIGFEEIREKRKSVERLRAGLSWEREASAMITDYRVLLEV